MAQEKVYSKRVRGDVSPVPTITRFGRVQKLPIKLRIQEKGVMQPTEIPKGRGICLRDLPGVKKRVENSPAKTQQALHQVLFARTDIGARLIENILAFNGWEFTSNRAFTATLLRRTHSLIMELCRIFSLPVHLTKERLVERLLQYLECPTLDVERRGFKQTSILQYMQPLTSDMYPLQKRSRRAGANSSKIKAESDQDAKVLWAVPVVSLEVLLARIKKKSMQ